MSASGFPKRLVKPLVLAAMAGGLLMTPLMAMAQAAAVPGDPAAAQVEEETCDAIRAEVEALDVDALTPREALDTLYRLKALAREG